jgi:hypothetical protein
VLWQRAGKDLLPGEPCAIRCDEDDRQIHEMVMTSDEALLVIRRLLLAADEDELMGLVALHLPSVDSTFFSTAEAAARQLEREGKEQVANALRGLTNRLLTLKTLI